MSSPPLPLKAALDRARELLMSAPGEALAIAEQALATLPADAPPADLAAARRMRGTALSYLGRHEEALRALDEALAELPEALLSDRLDLLRAQSIAHEQLGALDEALAAAVAAADLARTLGDASRLGPALLSLGVALSRSGDHAAGLDRYEEVLRLARARADASLELHVLNNMGISCKNLGRLDEAVAWLQQAVALADPLKQPGARAVALSNLGEPLARLGRRAEARAALEQALAGLQGGYAAALTNAQVQLADLLAEDGEAAAAQACYEAALAVLQATGSRNSTARAWLGLSRLHKAAGRFEAALAAHEAYHAAERAQFNEESDRRLRVLQVRHRLQQAQQDSELHRLRAAELAAQSRTDALTGLANRRHLDEQLEREVQSALALGQPLAVALADIDDFKQVNDRLGHAVGDEVLRAVAALLRTRVRGGDLASRYGGEEFCLVLPATDLPGAARVCEALRAAVAAHDWTTLHPALRVTLSIGLACLPAAAAETTPAALLREADHHLYDAKRRGKNRSQHA